MEIRKAAPAEIPQILKLLVQVNMVHHNGRPDLFKGPATNTLLGYAFCILKEVKDDRLLEDCKTLYVDDLCVEETSRGNGVGKALMTHAVQYAKDCGCRNVTLNVWSFNEKAMRFYQSFGMHEQRRTMELLL